jgi:hypothetical protein
MARFDYGKIQGIATKVLTNFSQATATEAITLISRQKGVGSSFEPGAHIPTPRALEGATATGVPSKFIERGLALEGDLLLISAVLPGVTIDVANDAITIGTKRYKIVADQSVPPIGVKVVWKFVIRRG